MFEQFAALSLLGAPKLYEFDDLAVFVTRIESGKRVSVLPFVFVHEPDGSFGFLPNKSRNRSVYDLVENWIAVNSQSLASGDLNRDYCSDAAVNQATHRVSLIAAAGKKPWHPSELFLAGASFDAPGGRAALVAQIKSTIQEMQSAMAAGNINEFVTFMTPEAGKKLEQTLWSTNEMGRQRVKATITERKPFFLFDASPLVVVMCKGKLSL